MRHEYDTVNATRHARTDTDAEALQRARDNVRRRVPRASARYRSER